MFAAWPGGRPPWPHAVAVRRVAGHTGKPRGQFVVGRVSYWLELRSPSLAGAWSPGLSELTVLGFAEGAWLQVLDTTAYQQSRFSLSSVGVGMRFRAARWVNGTLDYAWPLEDAGGVMAGDGRFLFSLAAEW